MIVQLPLTPNPNRTFKVLLDGQECTLSLRQKGTFLYMDIVKDSTVICQGAICLNLVPVVQVAQSNFSGNIVFVDVLGDSAPSYDLLGTRYFAVYYSNDENLSNVINMSL